MAYPQELIAFAVVPQSNAFLTAHTLSTTPAAVYGTWVAAYPIDVKRFMLQISTSVNDLTAAVIGLEKVTVGNVTSTLVQITVPNGTAARKVLYKDVTASAAVCRIGVGDKLQVNIKTCGVVGGTAAGAGFYSFLASLAPEGLANETNAIVSA